MCVHAQRTWRTNAFTAVRDDNAPNAAMRPLAKLLWAHYYYYYYYYYYHHHHHHQQQQQQQFISL